MNKDEEKAIEKLESVLNIADDTIADDILEDEIEVILELIKKQQEEIEKLKEDFNRANNIAIRNMTDYISKQKIRDKIIEYSYGIKVLQELLEEEK